jgi:hypothetical protein
MFEWAILTAKGKAIYDGASAIGKLELAAQVTELLGGLNEARARELDLLEEIRRLKEQVLKLEDAGTFVFQGGLYYRGDEGPFCPRCFDTREKRVRMHQDARGNWECMACLFPEYRDHITSPVG